MVKQGEHLSRIAHQYGFADYRTIWEHPNNAALKNKRKNPNVLFPGDQVFIPDKQEKGESCATTKRHRFQVARPPLKLRIVVKDFDDQPVANTECELEVEGAVYKLKTNAQGLIEKEIPRTAERGKLTIPDLGIEHPVKIGHLDPSEEDSGWQARLINLGYHAGPVGDSNEQIRAALEEFQCDHGLNVTGVLDAATKAKLEKIHGC